MVGINHKDSSFKVGPKPQFEECGLGLGDRRPVVAGRMDFLGKVWGQGRGASLD